MSAGPIVFVGPSVAASVVRELLPAARLAPPIRAGDLLAIERLSGAPPVLAIIDGAFEHVASVWHKEILRALARGCPVYGASSMGALRAAELHRYGMVGVGRIFENYRDGVIRDDGDVAVVHLPIEHSSRAVTSPMVDVTATVEAAVARGALDASAAAQVLARARDVPYRERHLDEVVPAAARTQPTSQKQLDAIALLERLRRDAPQPGSPCRELDVPTVFVRRLAAYVACRPMPFAAGWLPEPERLARLARLLGPRYQLVRHLALTRALCDALNIVPDRTAPDEERHLLRLFGLYGPAPDRPQIASARRIVSALASAWRALHDRLISDGVRFAPSDDDVLGFAAMLQTERLGLSSGAARDAWLTAHDLTDPAAHTSFLRSAFAFEHCLDPRAIGIYGSVAVAPERSWLVETLVATGVMEELAARAARWPQFAEEVRRWWSERPADMRERHAWACDLAGADEIARITRLPDPALA